MKPKIWLTALGLAILAVGINRAQPPGTEQSKVSGFGMLEPASPEAARAQAEAWLKEVGKTDAPTTARFKEIWAQDDRPVLDRVADTLVLGDERVAKALAEARNQLVPAPTNVPDVIKDAKASRFLKANLALAYARTLSNRRVHEEALAALKLIQPEHVVAPATFLFTKAVCEHALLHRVEATRTISRLLDEGVATPERYKTVAALMLLDMQTWKEKDLGAVARKMENVERRLEIARGGPETQKIQKEIIARLDELIKELENKAKKGGGGG